MINIFFDALETHLYFCFLTPTMNIAKWIASRPKKVREEGIQQTLNSSSNEIARFLLRKFDYFDPRGNIVYNDKWDVLILLDACRPDLLNSVSGGFDFLPYHIPVTRSVASSSITWLDRTFDKKYQDEMERTAYVTANPYSRNLDPRDFQMLDEVWKYGWDDEIGTVPPRNVTDRGIQTMREQNPDRLILHYMQPHFPSIPDQLADGIDIDSFGEERASVWSRLESDEISYEMVWNSYKSNLSYVLDDINLLLENMNANSVVLSADHGNAFGKLGIFGHPSNIPIDDLREVPWVTTTATDSGQYSPILEKHEETVEDKEIQSRLKDLGYV